MAKLLTTAEQIQGKTVRYVEMHALDAALAISFSDNTYCVFTIDAGLDPGDERLWLSGKFPVRKLGGAAIRMGLATAAELDAQWKKEQREREAKELESERKQFEKLKRKFEPEPKPITEKPMPLLDGATL